MTAKFPQREHERRSHELFLRAERRQHVHIGSSKHRSISPTGGDGGFEESVSALQLGSYLQKAALKKKEVEALVQLNAESSNVAVSLPRELAAAAVNTTATNKRKRAALAHGAGKSMGVCDAAGRNIESSRMVGEATREYVLWKDSTEDSKSTDVPQEASVLPHSDSHGNGRASAGIKKGRVNLFDELRQAMANAGTDKGHTKPNGWQSLSMRRSETESYASTKSLQEGASDANNKQSAPQTHDNDTRTSVELDSRNESVAVVEQTHEIGFLSSNENDQTTAEPNLDSAESGCPPMATPTQAVASSSDEEDSSDELDGLQFETVPLEASPLRAQHVSLSGMAATPTADQVPAFGARDSKFTETVTQIHQSDNVATVLGTVGSSSHDHDLAQEFAPDGTTQESAIVLPSSPAIDNELKGLAVAMPGLQSLGATSQSSQAEQVNPPAELNIVTTSENETSMDTSHEQLESEAMITALSASELDIGSNEHSGTVADRGFQDECTEPEADDASRQDTQCPVFFPGADSVLDRHVDDSSKDSNVPAVAQEPPSQQQQQQVGVQHLEALASETWTFISILSRETFELCCLW
jgi:hypothetical protein